MTWPFRYFLCVLMLVASSCAVRVVAQPVDELVLNADEPLGVFINNRYVSLAISTGSVDHITLNDDAVQALDLVAAPPDRIANLMIGGVVALRGRHGPAAFGMSDLLLRQELYWFPQTSRLPAQGTIGPFALPHRKVTISWGTGAVEKHAWPLVGSIDRASYGLVRLAKKMFVIGVDVRTRRRLPVASAATGADLAEVLGGRLVGEPWLEEIVMGVKRPVRRLELERPLVLGPMRFTAIAVRVGGAREGTSRLMPNQRPIQDENFDPAETLVRGRTAVRRPVTQMILLSRNQLEAQGCTSLTVAKREQKFILGCTESGITTAEAAMPVAEGDDMEKWAAVPLLADRLPSNPGVPQPTLAADGWLDVAADAPLAARIRGQPVDLVLSTGTVAGVYVNEVIGAQVQVGFQLVPGSMFPQRGPMQGRMRYGGVDVFELNGQVLNVQVAGRAMTRVVGWMPGSMGLRDLLLDGMIDFSILPYSRVRVNLPGPSRTTTPLTLRVARRRMGVAASGDVQLPGLPRFMLGAEVRERWQLPIATAALAADLVDRLDGQLTGPAWDEAISFGLKRRLRRLALARPLEIGPLRFEAVAVEVSRVRDRTTRLAPGQKPLPDVDADPEETVVRGRTIVGTAPIRGLALSRTQLEEQGCVRLALDKLANLWQLDCAGLPPLTPAASPAEAAYP